MISAVTGLNEARDGSTPDPNALVGVQKLAALNSNTATRHILDGSLIYIRSLAEALTYRVADILEYSDFKDDFINKIGKYNVSILGEISDLYIYDFGVFIEFLLMKSKKLCLSRIFRWLYLREILILKMLLISERLKILNLLINY